MKRTITLFILAITSLMKAQVPTPTLHIGIFSHNEMGNTGATVAPTYAEPYDTDQAYYNLVRDTLKKIADMINAKGAKYNMQTNQRFVYATFKWDAAGSPTVTTDIMEYIYKLGGSPYGNVVEIDPRFKTSGSNSVSPVSFTYNISDVAHWIDSTGAVASKNVGGFIYKPTTAPSWTASDWTQFTNTITGVYGIPWKANVIWGAGASIMPIHTQDANNYGIWKPRGTADSIDFYCHNPAQNLYVQGNGCAWNLDPAISATTIISEIRDQSTKIRNGTFPANKFYCAALMINFKHFHTPGLRAKLTQIIDSINVMVGQGKIKWATISQKQAAFQAWSTANSIPYSQWRCGQTVTLAPTCAPTGIHEYQTTGNDFLKLAPNPATDKLLISWEGQLNDNTRLFIYDGLGRKVFEEPMEVSLKQISLQQFNSGIYTVIMQNDAAQSKAEKLIISH